MNNAVQKFLPAAKTKDETPPLPSNWSFATWQEAWRDMGRSEEWIAEHEAARKASYAAQDFSRKYAGTPGGKRRGGGRVRERLHGFTRRRFDARCERLARVSGYIIKALLRGWRRDPLSARELFRMAWARCVGGKLASEAMARAWKDVWDWVRNIYLKLARERGTEAETMRVSESYLQSYSQNRHEKRIRISDASDGTGARVEFYESKRPLNDETAPAEAGFSPLAPKPASGLTPLVGACAFGNCERDSGFYCSKGNAGLGSVAGRAGTPGKAAECAENARVAKFTGKLPRRLWWLVWKWLPAFGRLHYGKNVAWSDAHFISWFKSCLVAGKRCADLLDLYEEKLMKWHGLASDWRVPGDKDLHPRGLFAELYKAAAALPAINSAD